MISDEKPPRRWNVRGRGRLAGVDVSDGTEEWLPVVGHEGYYEVSDQGRVRSLSRIVTYRDGHTQALRGRVLSPGKQPLSGHLHVNLKANGSKRSVAVHALVLEAFVGPRPPGQECCHGNGDPTDNNVVNLRWDTRSGNVRDAIRHGTNWQVRKKACPKGHPYDERNTRSGPGVRVCRECHRLRSSARHAARADVRHGTHVSSRKTHCKNGHPFDEANTRHSPRGRICRTCDHARGSASRAKRRAP